MNHQEIKNNNIIEKYLLHELDKKEETLFEEHLLYCQDCMEELEQTKKIIFLLKPTSLTTPKKQSHFLSRIHWNVYKYAAILILLVGIAYTINWLVSIQNKTIYTNYATINITDTLNHKKPIQDTTQYKENIEKNNLIAGNYKPNPIYENEINNNYRDNGVFNIKPTSETIVKTGTGITFNWETTISDSIKFVLIDNTGIEKITKTVKTSYVLNTNIPAGLYYWQLQSESELLFTGKIKITKN